MGPPASYPIVSSRYDLLQVAQKEGLRVPETGLLNSHADIAKWADGHAFPWVIKADGTWGGRGVKVARTRQEAVQWFARMKQPMGAAQAFKRLMVNRDAFGIRPWRNRTEPDLAVQAFIQGRPANCAVVCHQGSVLAGIAVEVVTSQGATGPAMVVRVVDGLEMMKCAERLARRLNLTGFFGLDFVIEEETDDTYLIEMNPRGTPLCHLQLGKGRDMVDAFVVPAIWPAAS